MVSASIYKRALYTIIFVVLAGTILVLISTFKDGLREVFQSTSMAAVWFDTALRVIYIILGMLIVIAIVRFAAFLLLQATTRRAAQSEIRSLLKTVFSILIYIIAFFIIFQTQYPDVSLAPLFTGSTILGIVVGLALQDTLGNLFAGLAMQADQLFQVGDVINIAGRGVGVVESISWRGVKVRTFQNKLLVISNAVLGKESIEVAPRTNLNARLVNFSTVYTESPANTAHLIREAVRQCENVSPKMRPVVRIRDLGADGIDWEIKYWLVDYSKYNDSDALVRQRVWYVCQREKIDFAYPTRTVHMVPEAEHVTPDEILNTNAEHLNNVPIFAPLSDEETEQLANASTTRVYAPNEPIVRKGQEGNSMFVILRGAVKVQIPEADYQKTVNRLGPHDYFGEMSLLTGDPRSATVIAEVETEVLRIKKEALKPIFENNPDLVQTISELIEERRQLLTAEAEAAVDEELASQKGVLRSIRKFFGLKSR